MATIDTDRVDKELRAMIKTSNVIKAQLRSALEKLEKDPSEFERLKYVPPSLSAFKNLDSIRKIKLISKKHDFRIVFAHWKFESGAEHSDLLIAFPRKAGYDIDWDWIEQQLAESEDWF